MLRDLANKIEELVEGQVKPEFVEHDGLEYIKTKDGFRLNKYPEARGVSLYSLTGLVEMVKTTVKEEVGNIKLPLLINVDRNDVKVLTTLDRYNNRSVLFDCSPTVPRIDFGSEMSVEQFIVLLSTAFVDTENTRKLIGAVSQLSVVEEIKLEDDGVTQTVTAKQGSSLSKKYQLQPIVNLKPIRTYSEIEQVESKYLLRVSKVGGIRLLEADGGQWIMQAQQRIVEYLKLNLEELIKDNKVVIVG